MQWVLRGLDTEVINMVMQTGDKLLADGNAHIALNFYREAVFLFPDTTICKIREAQCLLALVSIDLNVQFTLNFDFLIMVQMSKWRK